MTKERQPKFNEEVFKRRQEQDSTLPHAQELAEREGVERRVDVLDLVRMTKQNADSIKELGADFKHGMDKLTDKLVESTLAVTRLTVTMEHMQRDALEHTDGQRALEKRVTALEMAQGRTLLAASSIGGIVGFAAGILAKWLMK
jgi:hypothetical protein